MTKQQTIDTLKKQLPGFYSAEQVIKMISDIEDASTNEFKFSKDQIEQLSSNITDMIESEGTNIIDDYDLSINYKEVELDAVNYDESRLNNIIRDAIEEFIENINEDDE